MSRSTIPAKRSADTQEAAWVADEDRFVLQQAKKKAAIRVKSGRAQPIDWLAVTLATIDPERNGLDDELEDPDLDVLDPESVFEGLGEAELRELEKGVDTYLALESSRSNREYWNMMKTISTSRSQSNQQSVRGLNSVSSDLDKLLAPKTLPELEKLEKQIRAKLASDEPIDTDYWDNLLQSLLTYKAKAKLKGLTSRIVEARLESLRNQQVAEAEAWRKKLEASRGEEGENGEGEPENGANGEGGSHALDPEPMLRLSEEDKKLESFRDEAFAQSLVEERKSIIKKGYIPLRHSNTTSLTTTTNGSKRQRIESDSTSQPVNQSTSLLSREVARGLNDNEEIFTTEEPVSTKNIDSWKNTYRPRKPQYFARVIKGFEWNKYNQTHYDHDNPPPRVIQGYRFNLFYPDLVDKVRAPTYRIERENGRRKGEMSAPAGENDTCVLRFMAGPPYEDIGFRVVDREWDFSAKRERGFKSSFDKGNLLLHFQFKKIYYRK